VNPKQSFSKWKTPLIFVGALLLALAFNTVIGFTPNESVLESLWRGLREIRPMEYLMFAAFWYAFTGQPKDKWHSSLISLNLSNRK
jgi:aspartate racemase